MYIHLYHINNLKTKNMTTQVTIQTEFKRREDLINDLNFRKVCAKHAEKIGITSKEWNDNKISILMFFANEFCGVENKLNN